MTTVDPGAQPPDDARELRRQLEEARDELRAIRTGGFDALVIDSGSGDELFTLRSTEPPHRLVEVVVEGALTYFRAVAVDYDGTLAEGRIAPDTLAALAEARTRGVRVILVTGRIMSELRAVFPDVEDSVDAVVAENGALLVTPVGIRQLAAPIDRAVSAALSARGVVCRSGQVLVACAAADEPAALEVIRELGLDCQLVRNRGELMIVPAGVTKGSGLLEALGDLGLSRHNTIGVGDGENDHSLLDVCEIGVAVANAVDALRAHADVTLVLPDGRGVAELLRGPLLTGRAQLHPRRWQITLGVDDGGEAVTLPASQLNVAVCGGTGEGKSYLAGLVCEQLVQPRLLAGRRRPGRRPRRAWRAARRARHRRRGTPPRRPRRGRAPASPPLRERGRRRLPPRRRRPGRLRGAPARRDRSPAGDDRPPPMGGRRRGPRLVRADRDGAEPVQPRRQGLPTRHLAARGTVGRGPGRAGRRDRPQLTAPLAITSSTS